MFNYDDLYEIGTLGKPHGVKGEIAFRFSDDVFDRADADYLFVEVDGLPVPKPIVNGSGFQPTIDGWQGVEIEVSMDDK